MQNVERGNEQKTCKRPPETRVLGVKMRENPLPMKQKKYFCNLLKGGRGDEF